ncbi:hypothetical protein XELAEV_18002226mg [Xenopus laevis]|nr:hypothetical protein XELAEV_18002226mg [Xenopus laevis]
MGNTLIIINRSKHLVTYVCAYQVSQQTLAYGKLKEGHSVTIFHQFSVPCYLYIKRGDCSEADCRVHPDYFWIYNPISSPVYTIEELTPHRTNLKRDKDSKKNLVGTGPHGPHRPRPAPHWNFGCCIPTLNRGYKDEVKGEGCFHTNLKPASWLLGGKNSVIEDIKGNWKKIS